MKTFRFLLMLAATVMMSAVTVSADSYYCKHIGIREGLSQPSVTCIRSDHQGAIWIGTRFGLNRYRSNAIRTFIDDSTPQSSISGNYILDIFLDSAENLWVSTEKGLSMYDQDNEKFTLQTDEPVSSIFENAGLIYFGGKGHVFIYDLRKKRFMNDIINIDGALNISAFFRYGTGKILIVDKLKGLFTYDILNGSLRNIHIPELAGEVILSSCIFGGRAYISVYNKGLYIIDLEDIRLERVCDSSNSGLSFNVILAEMSDGKSLWLGTDGGGICIMDTATGVISRMSADGTLDNSVTSIYKDERGNIWAGSVRSGAFGMKKVPIRTFREESGLEESRLSNDVVISLWVSDDGNVWAGTDGGGVDKLDPSDGNIRTYDSTGDLKISSIAEFDEHRMIISVYTKGLFLMDKENGTLTAFKIVNDSVNQEECFSGCSPMLFKIDKDHLYILAEHAYSCNVRTGVFTEFSFDCEEVSEMKLFSGNRDSWLYAFSDRGIFRLSDMDKRVESMYRTTRGSAIKTAAYAGGRIWFGTDYGLYCIDKNGGEPEKISTSTFSRVTQLKASGDDLLWIAADNMLFCYHIQEQRFEVVDESEGFSSNEILCSSISNDDSDDAIFLGGTCGLVEIQKDYAIHHSHPVSSILQLYGVYADGRKLKPGKTHVTVPYKFSDLSVAVNLKDIDPFKKEMYRYVLDGETKITAETYSDEFHIQTLQGGIYTVSASYLMNDGTWSEPQKLVRLNVLFPWYRQWWFYLTLLALALCIIGAVCGWIWSRNKAKMRDALMEQKEKAATQRIRFLVNVSHELRTPLTLVYSPLKKIIDSIDSPETKARLTKVFVNAGKMRDIINTVLEKERLDAFPGDLLDDSSDSIMPVKAQDSETTDCDVTGYTVLFVEDNAELRSLLQDSMSGYFRETYTAENGKEALEMIRHKNPDIVVSDIMMPEMDGFSLCRALKADLEISHIPIVLLTAKSDADSILTGYKSGADAYLTKPFDVELLVTVINNILKGRESVKKQINDFPERAVSPVESTFTQADEQLMVRLDKFIRDNIGDETIDVPKIVSEMAISRALLYVKVKALTGMGIAQYIDKIRIQTACDMLRDTDKSISEIAEACGFSSARYFSGHFKQVTGASPSDWRKGV